jgi:sulfur carrier protein ThiS
MENLKMSVPSTLKREAEVTLLRPDLGSQTFNLPEGATLADLLREAGGEIQAKNVLIDGRPVEEFVILNSGMAITVIPEPLGQRKRSWLDTVGMFADDPDFEEAVAAGRAYREADRQATLEQLDREDP